MKKASFIFSEIEGDVHRDDSNIAPYAGELLSPQLDIAWKLVYMLTPGATT